MTTEPEKKVRQQLSNVTSTTISPARVRLFLDPLGINRDVEDRLNAIKKTISDIKKEGGPKPPAHIEALKKDSSDAQRTKHDEAKAKYLAELKKYNDFTSEKYKTLETAYELCKHLTKLHDLLMKPTRNENQDTELAALKELVHDRPAALKKGETKSTFDARVEKFEAAGFTPLVGNVDLTDAPSVQTLINKLKKNNVGIEHFLLRDATSRSRVRFNDQAAVALATLMEAGIEELLEHGMKHTIEVAKKKTIQPDNCVSSELSQCEWKVLFNNLPTLVAIRNRQKRKFAWETNQNRIYQEAVKKAKATVKKTGKAYVKPVKNVSTFPEDEVEHGFVERTYTAVEVTAKDGTKSMVDKPHYQWFGIDIPNPEDVKRDDPDFYFYVQQVCKKIIAREDKFAEIKISTNIKKFFSDLIIDFIARISPQIRILIDAMGVKTVDANVIKTVLRMIVTDDYHSADGKVQFNEEHTYIFALIDEKVELCKVHQTGQVTKVPAEEHEDAPQIVDEVDEVDVPSPGQKLGHSKDPTETVSVEESDLEAPEVRSLPTKATVRNAKKINPAVKTAKV